MTKTFRLILEVTYESEDGSPLDDRALIANLEDIPSRAAGEGLMSQGTNAIVTEWHAKVDTVFASASS